MKIFKREAINYTLKMEEELAEKEKTVFMLKPLSTKQFMQLQDKIDFSNDAEGFKVKNFSSYSYEVVKAGLVDWDNVIDENDKPIKFNMKDMESNLDYLTSNIIQELASKINEISTLTEKQIKN